MFEAKELDPTFRRMLPVWWLFAWRGTLCGALLGGLVGFVIALAWMALQISPENLNLVTAIAGGLVGLVWGFVVLRMALRKKYSGFRIALVPVTAAA